ncbi:MAG: dephospho-CoA kinase [Dysgonamonadaceae bacterium]|jgi:dephospho-CoA kinase|nr:dephospho-CoA kinase [Dysgonamonadaceae bacterium]
MIKLGITGGIGAGKSVVASFLKATGIPVYVADDESKKITSTSPRIKEQLIKQFGEDLYAGGVLNKVLLASLIFENKENLKIVNSIIHPEVVSDFETWSTKHSNKNIVAIETAILFESKLDKIVDIIITVTAPQEERIQRVLKRNNTTREEILSRMSNQLPDEEKCRMSDFVIYNDNDRAIIPQIESLLLI